MKDALQTDGLFVIPESNGRYLASLNGEIYSLITNKYLRQGICNAGYRTVALRVDGKTHTKMVHRLVMSAVTGYVRHDMQINHKDGNKLNNKAENLEWATRSMNMLHSTWVLGNVASIYMPRGLNFHAKGVEGYTKDGVVVEKFSCIQDAKDKGYQPPSICHAISGRRQKTHRGLYWRHSNQDFS